MLVIREEQMAVFKQRRQNVVSVELSQVLRDNYNTPFQFYSEQQLNHWVNKQIDFLAECNVTGKKTVVDFIELFAIFGEKFERSKDPLPALKLLEQTARSEEIRLDNILKWVDKELA